MAITYFGNASFPADNGTQAGPGPTTITPPGSMQSGDLVLVFQQYRGTDLATSFDVSATGGQSWHKLVEYGTATLSLVSLACFACRFNGTWSANPSFVADSTLAHTAWMVVLRPTSSAKIMDIDVGAVKGTFTAGSTPFTKTITGITTLHDGAIAIALWASADDNTWGSLTGGWSNPGGTAQTRNLSGSDQSMAIAYQVFPTAGATGNVAMNQATLGGDAGATLIIAFYERDEPTGIPTVDVYTDFEDSTDGTTITGTILNNGTHPASPGGTWAEILGGGSSNMTIETTAEQAFGGSRKVTTNSVTYDDAGSTRGFQQDHSTQADLAKNWKFTLASSSTLVSVGHYFHTTMAYGNSTNFSCTINQLVDGGFTGLIAFNWDVWRSATFLGYAENAASEIAPFANFSNNTWYWVTMQFDKNANIGKIALYNPSTWAQVGFTGVLRLGVTPANANGIAIGQNGGGLQSQAALTYLDDLVIDYTTGAFPLFPRAAAGGTGAFPFQSRHSMAHLLVR